MDARIKNALEKNAGTQEVFTLKDGKAVKFLVVSDFKWNATDHDIYKKELGFSYKNAAYNLAAGREPKATYSVREAEFCKEHPAEYRVFCKAHNLKPMTDAQAAKNLTLEKKAAKSTKSKKAEVEDVDIEAMVEKLVEQKLNEILAKQMKKKGAK